VNARALPIVGSPFRAAESSRCIRTNSAVKGLVDRRATTVQAITTAMTAKPSTTPIERFLATGPSSSTRVDVVSSLRNAFLRVSVAVLDDFVA
jgi:hypothetical protein